MAEVPVAQYVTDHTFDLEDGDLIESVFVIGKYLDPDGGDGVIIASGGSMGVITQLGLVEAAKQILDQGWGRRDDL